MGAGIGLLLLVVSHFIASCFSSRNVPNAERFYKNFDDKVSINKILSKLIKFGLWKNNDYIFFNIKPGNYGTIPTQSAFINIGLKHNDEDKQENL